MKRSNDDLKSVDVSKPHSQKQADDSNGMTSGEPQTKQGNRKSTVPYLQPGTQQSNYTIAGIPAQKEDSIQERDVIIDQIKDEPTDKLLKASKMDVLVVSQAPGQNKIKATSSVMNNTNSHLASPMARRNQEMMETKLLDSKFKTMSSPMQKNAGTGSQRDLEEVEQSKDAGQTIDLQPVKMLDSGSKEQQNIRKSSKFAQKAPQNRRESYKTETKPRKISLKPTQMEFGGSPVKQGDESGEVSPRMVGGPQSLDKKMQNKKVRKGLSQTKHSIATTGEKAILQKSDSQHVMIKDAVGGPAFDTISPSPQEPHPLQHILN